MPEPEFRPFLFQSWPSDRPTQEIAAGGFDMGGPKRFHPLPVLLKSNRDNEVQVLDPACIPRFTEWFVF